MDLQLKNKIAMIAAASKGIGKGITLSLAKEGCKVSICGRDNSNLTKAKNEILNQAPDAEILTVSCDVSNKEDLENWYNSTKKEFGDINILVTNTGGPPPGRFPELTEEKWKLGVESTLMNVVRLSNLVIPDMKKNEWGRIVHITSLAAKQPVDILSISNTIRAGISALTKTTSNEYAQYGICINAVLPGHIYTDRQIALNEIKSGELNISVEQYAQRIQDTIPTKRYGKIEEIGDVVAFLCSQNASYINGVSLQVDGGIIQSTF